MTRPCFSMRWFGSVLILWSLASGLQAEGFLREGAPRATDIGNLTGLGAGDALPALVKELSPAVVNISVEGEAPEEAQVQLEGLPFFKKESDRPYRSVGSGFIVNGDGYIVTSNHVIEGSDRIVVRLLDDRTDYPAKVVGRDPKTDLALLKIESAQELPEVYVGDSDSVEVGEWVVAIGNQFHLGQTVTAGIVSAKSRRVPGRSGSPYDQFIQTDASINPGSSGGPLFNGRGQVIGINTAIFSPTRAQSGGTGFNIGIGFAVPVNVLKSIINQLKSEGKVTRGLLGVRIQEVDDGIARALGLSKTEGALVAEIIKGTPAEKAEFRRKDVIVEFNRQAIKEFEDLPLLVANTKVGTEVPIVVMRGGRRQTLRTKIEEVTIDDSAQLSQGEKADSIGVIVDELTDSQARALEMVPGTGVIVTAIQPNSDAEKAGLLKGDAIEEVGDVVIKGRDSFEKLISALPDNAPTLLTVRRKDGIRILTLRGK